jgi:3-oxoacyl-[acyl-carrier protein] reductase
MKNLKGKNIIITGGSSGIGCDIAKYLAKLDARIFIISRTSKDLKRVIKKINEINKLENFYHSMDISNTKEFRKLEQKIKNLNLKFDCLINCAGVYGPIGNTLDIDLNSFKKTFDINFFGSLNMILFIKKFFKKNIRKKIINFSGGGAASPFPNYSAYATTKVAIVRLTENLSLELKDENYDINCIAPGFVITRLHNKTIKSGPSLTGTNFYDMTKKMIETGGVSSDYTCKLVHFFLSKKSDKISGKFISANWDNWNEAKFIKSLRKDNDFATLRRIDNKNFYKK